MNSFCHFNMRNKDLLAALILLILAASCSGGHKVERPETYNYQRGCEAFYNEQWGEALDYFNKDIQENPKSGYSFAMVAYARLSIQDYGRALTAVETALKYLPKSDKEFLAATYSIRGHIQLALKDTVEAIADYSKAIHLDPDDIDLYENRAQLYFELQKYDLSDADYRKMTVLEPGNTMGYTGIGRNANNQKRWEDALKQFNYVIKLAEDYSFAYSLRAEAFLGLEKWDEAVDDIITALDMDFEEHAAYLATTLEEPALTMFELRTKVKAAKAPNEMVWPYMLGYVAANNRKDYDKAIRYFREANEIDTSPGIYSSIADCFAQKGDLQQAIKEINRALELDSTRVTLLDKRADFYYEVGNINAVIAEYDKMIVLNPDFEYAYYSRGWIKFLKGDLDGALEDLTMSIALDPKHVHSYVIRGDIYMKQGETGLGEADYRKVIELEDTPEKYDCIQYAYHGLGQDEKALEVMEQIIQNDTTDEGNYYDAACLYGRMGNREKSLEYLEKALEKGYNSFMHLTLDSDMDLIRDTEEYKSLLKKYNNRAGLDVENFEKVVEAEEQRTSEVPFTKEGGVCKIKCKINDLPLYFIFDTGASEVSLSMVEATFMLKNGYLSERDVIGSQAYMDANGNVSVGTKINLKKVSFGDSELTNVRASVVRNQKAPLLLGQSVLGRLGKIEIDNQKRVLRITH